MNTDNEPIALGALVTGLIVGVANMIECSATS